MRFRHVTAAVAAAVLLAGCGDAGNDQTGASGTGADAGTGADTGTGADAGTGAEADLPNPDEFITDGVFRGLGVVLPVPDGWSVDEFGLMQGLVVASDDADERQQMAAQAVDSGALPEDQQIDFDELVDLQRNQFAELDANIQPAVDEEVQVEGADRAQHLRFDNVEIQDQPALTLDVVLAEDGQGRIVLFNYAAPSEAYDEATAQLLLDGAGIDPDSEPPAPEPMAPPGGTGGEGGTGAQPEDGTGTAPAPGDGTDGTDGTAEQDGATDGDGQG